MKSKESKTTSELNVHVCVCKQDEISLSTSFAKVEWSDSTTFLGCCDSSFFPPSGVMILEKCSSCSNDFLLPSSQILGRDSKASSGSMMPHSSRFCTQICKHGVSYSAYARQNLRPLNTDDTTVILSRKTVLKLGTIDTSVAALLTTRQIRVQRLFEIILFHGYFPFLDLLCNINVKVGIALLS